MLPRISPQSPTCPRRVPSHPVAHCISPRYRPLFNFGVRPDQYAQVLNEVNKTKWLIDATMYEEDTKSRVNLGQELRQPFSEFKDPELYGGFTVDGRYLQQVYCKFGDSVAEAMDTLTKLCSARRRR